MSSGYSSKRDCAAARRTVPSAMPPRAVIRSATRSICLTKTEAIESKSSCRAMKCIPFTFQWATFTWLWRSIASASVALRRSTSCARSFSGRSTLDLWSWVVVADASVATMLSFLLLDEALLDAPLALRETALEVAPLLAEVVARRIGAILRHAEEVDRLGRRGAGWEAPEHFLVQRDGVVILPQPQPGERCLRQETRDEFVWREIPVPVREVVSFGVEDPNVRCPDVAVSLNDGRGGFDRAIVLHGNGEPVDGVSHGIFGIRHGIQRFAAPSVRVEEVDQDEFVRILGLVEGIVEGLRPLDFRSLVGCRHRWDLQ